jgi:hypothetical protein
MEVERHCLSRKFDYVGSKLFVQTSAYLERYYERLPY